jgi:hypothetical protein
MKDMMYALRYWLAERNIPAEGLSVEITFRDHATACRAFEHLKLDMRQEGVVEHPGSLGSNFCTLYDTPLRFKGPTPELKLTRCIFCHRDVSYPCSPWFATVCRNCTEQR